MSNAEKIVSEDLIRAILGNAAQGYFSKDHGDQLRAILAKPAQQHQREPVALPGRDAMRRAYTACKYHAPHIFEAGWNSYHDEIAKLGPLYTHPVKGEPVAWTWQGSLDTLRGYCPAGVAVFPHKSPGTPIPLYTHADPAEVERLRAQLHDLAMAIYKSHYAKTAPNFEPFDFASGLIGQIDNMVAGLLQDVSTLRGDVETMRRKNNEYWHESEAMRAQLAEAHALLQQAIDNEESFNFDQTLIVRIKRMLSASAEPSAPVEIDERAEFDAWFKDHSKDWPFPSESIKCIARDNDWLVWQARAALERKQQKTPQ